MMKLRVAERDDLEIIYSMQKEAFAPLYEKYQDTETSPATEPFEKTIQRFNNINVTYYLIVVEKNDRSFNAYAGSKFQFVEMTDRKLSRNLMVYEAAGNGCFL